MGRIAYEKETGWDGIIEKCDDMKCNYACCQFGKLGNFIALFPGELEKAKEEGLGVDHLDIVEPATETKMGKAHCLRPCENNELKPIDCAIYPLWPKTADFSRFIRGEQWKCPLENVDLQLIALSVKELLTKAGVNPELVVPVASEMVAYADWPYHYDQDSNQFIPNNE